jgi:D-alanine-D-alanine ligase
MKKKKVALLVGGMSAEREVSLSTGKGFEKALIELGYPYVVIDAGPELPKQLMEHKPDVALLALHGKYAEDGIVQGICEYLKIPYSGSGVLSSATCMDKIFTKEILINHGIPTPKYEIKNFNNSATSKDLKLPLPVVIKPSREGSSVGVSIVKTENEIIPALEMARTYDKHVLIEEFIPGMELTVAVLNDLALTPIEIVPKVDYYNYKNKYTAGQTEYILPARLPEKTLEQIKTHAVEAAKVLRVRSYCRVDFRVNPQGLSYIMEVNTLPGCTPTSLLPKAAAHMGIPFSRLIEILVEGAALDYAGVK